MLSDAKPADGKGPVEAADGGQSGRSGSPDRRDAPVWAFGSRLMRRNVEIGRKAYLRYAEAAELGLNAIDSTHARASADLRAISENLRALDRRGVEALAAKAGRRRAAARAVALRGQIAADTNVRACFDCAEALADASSLQDLVSVQATFLADQWQRSLRQMLDLQRMSVGLLRKAAVAGAA